MPKETTNKPVYEIMLSCEELGTFYICVQNARLIFRDGRYDGWYYPGPSEE